jgi:hypothetical protein
MGQMIMYTDDDILTYTQSGSEVEITTWTTHAWTSIRTQYTHSTMELENLHRTSKEAYYQIVGNMQ